MERDKGLMLMIRAGTGNNITPSFYFSIAIDRRNRRRLVPFEHRQLQSDRITTGAICSCPSPATWSVRRIRVSMT